MRQRKPLRRQRHQELKNIVFGWAQSPDSWGRPQPVLGRGVQSYFMSSLIWFISLICFDLGWKKGQCVICLYTHLSVHAYSSGLKFCENRNPLSVNRQSSMKYYLTTNQIALKGWRYSSSDTLWVPTNTVEYCGHSTWVHSVTWCSKQPKKAL